MQKYLLSILLSASTSTFAATLDNLPRPILKTTEFLPQIEPEIESTPQKTTSDINVSDEDLKKDRELTQTLLNQAILIHRWDLVERILAIYLNFEQKDIILVRFAQAGLAKQEKNYKKTITFYREIIAARPDLTPVRLELAIALFEDRQDEAARDQFNKVLSDSPPQNVAQQAQSYINALNRRDSWSFNFGLNYLREENINNISKNREIENTGFIKNDNMMPKSAKGFSFYFGLERNFNLKNNHYLRIENSLFAKSFWDNHDNDDLINRLSVGYLNISNQRTLAVLPFYEKRWYGGKQYKDNKGLRLEYDYWLSPNLRIINAVEYSKQYYKDYEQLDGNNKLFSTTLFWLRKSEQFFFGGLDFFAERSGEKQYSSDFRNIRVGWGQEWSYGISSRVSLAMGQRRYKSEAVIGGLIPLAKKRDDKEYNINLTLWKRDWHVLGVTPKLNYQWRKTESNIPSMYSFSKNRLMLIFEKSF